MRLLWLANLVGALAATMWRDDGSGLSRSAGKSVFVDDIPYRGDTKVSAQYLDEVKKGVNYWEVKAQTPGGFSVGLTSENSLGPKYKTKGYFYNGNLSDGGGMLRMNFGPRPTGGDRVGMLVEYGDRMKVWFYVNGEPLGLAFDIPLPAVPLYPTISFKTGGSTATISTPPAPSRRQPVNDASDVPGKWMTTFEAQSTPMTIEATDAGYRGSVRLLNIMSFSMTRQTDGRYITTTGATTLMAGPPEKMEAESNLAKFLNTVTSLTLTSRNTLVFGGDQMDLVFTRDQSRPPPVTDVVISQ